jgi:chromosome segregation ATPase
LEYISPAYLQLRSAEVGLQHERARNEQLAAEVTLRQEKYLEKKGQIKELEKQLAAKAGDEAREQKKRVSVEADMVKLREQLALRITAFDAARKTQEEQAEKLAKLDKQLQQQRATTAQSVADLHKLHSTSTKLSEQLDEQVC